MPPSEKSKDCYRCRLARFKRMFVTRACLGSIQQAVGGGFGFSARVCLPHLSSLTLPTWGNAVHVWWVCFVKIVAWRGFHFGFNVEV